jgi:L-alanine-DL-glutamate epimerase-like enolase superfamily enzyme
LSLVIKDVQVETVQSTTEWTFVRVHAGKEYGTGEATAAPGLKASEPTLRKLLVGEDAMKINRIEEKLRHASLFAGSSFYPLISATNIALYDLIGKKVNLPVWRLLGGDRDEIRVYVDLHAGEEFGATNALLTPVKLDSTGKRAVAGESALSDHPVMGRLAREEFGDLFTPEAYSRAAKRAVKEGYQMIKFDLDIPTPFTDPFNKRSGQVTLREADYMAEIVAAVRGTIGDDVELMVDLHWRYDLNSSLRICKGLEPFRLHWVEDLTPATRSVGNIDELGMLTSLCPIPIATGENLYTVSEFKDLLNTGVRVWTPDICKTGGITEARRIMELASMYDIEVSPHNVTTPIGTVASAHAASISNTFGALEFHSHGFGFWYEMIRSKKSPIDRGFLRLTEEPGLGVELDERVMTKYWPDFEL